MNGLPVYMGPPGFAGTTMHLIRLIGAGGCQSVWEVRHCPSDMADLPEWYCRTDTAANLEIHSASKHLA